MQPMYTKKRISIDKNLHWTVWNVSTNCYQIYLQSKIMSNYITWRLITLLPRFSTRKANIAMITIKLRVINVLSCVLLERSVKWKHVHNFTTLCWPFCRTHLFTAKVSGWKSQSRVVNTLLYLHVMNTAWKKYRKTKTKGRWNEHITSRSNQGSFRKRL